MTAPWMPIVIVDVTGSAAALILAVLAVIECRRWLRLKSADIFRQYIFLLTVAIVTFTISRSVGHLVKQFLIFNGRAEQWDNLAPYSGTINTITFAFIFGVGIFFQRVRKVHKEMEENRRQLEASVTELQAALDEVQTLSGLLPICSSCKKVRDDNGYWKQIEAYISDHSEARFSHSLCPNCQDDLYHDDTWYQNMKSKESE